MRTDTQRLDFLLQVMEQQDEAAAERIQGAFMLDLKGRTALDAAMGAKLIEPGEPMPELTAIDLAVAEVGRIRNVKGFSEKSDDKYMPDALAEAAAAYLLVGRKTEWNDAAAHEWWPWSPESFKPSPDDRKKELTKGIALALCELDRLIRAERRDDEGKIGDGSEGLPFSEMRIPERDETRKFKVGDRVRIVSNAQDNPWGWCAEMDARVGTLGAIERVADEETDEPGYEVDGLTYPASQLEQADD